MFKLLNVLNKIHFLPTDINIQMQYTSLIVSEESTTATLCAMIIDGFLGKNVSVLLETHSITGVS